MHSPRSTSMRARRQVLCSAPHSACNPDSLLSWLSRLSSFFSRLSHLSCPSSLSSLVPLVAHLSSLLFSLIPLVFPPFFLLSIGSLPLASPSLHSLETRPALPQPPIPSRLRLCLGVVRRPSATSSCCFWHFRFLRPLPHSTCPRYAPLHITTAPRLPGRAPMPQPPTDSGSHIDSQIPLCSLHSASISSSAVATSTVTATAITSAAS